MAIVVLGVHYETLINLKSASTLWHFYCSPVSLCTVIFRIRQGIISMAPILGAALINVRVAFQNWNSWEV